MWFLYIMFTLFAFVIVGKIAGLVRTFSNINKYIKSPPMPEGFFQIMLLYRV